MSGPMRPGIGGQEATGHECRQIDLELDAVFSRHAALRGGEELSEDARLHLRSCERCRGLYHWLTGAAGADPPSPAVPAAMVDSVSARMKHSLRPVKAQSSPAVLAARFLLLFLLCAAPVLLMMRTPGLTAMSMAQLSGMLLVLLGGAALLSLSLAWQISPGSLRRVSAGGAVTALSGSFLASIAALYPWHEPQGFLEHGRSCLSAGLLMAAPAAVFFWLLVRRGYPLATRMVGATVGALAGLLGAFVLQFCCDRQEAVHLLVWHGGVLFAAVAVGAAMAWVGNRPPHYTASE